MQCYNVNCFFYSNQPEEQGENDTAQVEELERAHPEHLKIGEQEG